jgi:hypothetical protein
MEADTYVLLLTFIRIKPDNLVLSVEKEIWGLSFGIVALSFCSKKYPAFHEEGCLLGSIRSRQVIRDVVTDSQGKAVGL